MPRALMRSGQIKSNERRHEKNDRYPIGDRSRFVLGWDNQAKLKVLRAEQAELRRRLVAINTDRERLKQQQREHDRKLRGAETLLELKEFSRIDWRGTAAAIQRLEDEKRALEESDDQLRTLREQFTEIDEQYKAADGQREEAGNKRRTTGRPPWRRRRPSPKGISPPTTRCWSSGANKCWASILWSFAC